MLVFDKTFEVILIHGPSYSFAKDFASTTFYDYLALRLGIGDLCYGAGFQSTFTNPGGELVHSRAFTGPVDPTHTLYSKDFMIAMGDYWYSATYNSQDSINLAIADSADRLPSPPYPSGCSAFSYYSSGSLFYITHVG